MGNPISKNEHTVKAMARAESPKPIGIDLEAR
jgi:hypothetical protein